jgi:hypothetical protein
MAIFGYFLPSNRPPGSGIAKFKKQKLSCSAGCGTVPVCKISANLDERPRVYTLFYKPKNPIAHPLAKIANFLKIAQSA